VYDNYRSNPCFIDGLKPSARKILYVVLKNNIREPVKVAQLQSKVAEQTQYLHGEASLGSVIVGLAQDYVGSNNLPYLKREGSFGSRFTNLAAASRYIFTCKEPYLDNLFPKEYNDILISQEFEGEIIEPRFFVPSLPMLLVNGSEGIGNGFAHKILPRNIEEIKSYIKSRSKGEDVQYNLIPHYNGFNGVILKISDVSFEIRGSIEVKSSTEIFINEIPVGKEHKEYVSTLQELKDAGKIKSFEDLCDDRIDKFRFLVKVDKKFTAQTETKMLEDLKLIKRVSENYTFLNENNEIVIFNSVNEIFDAYIKIKLEYTLKRKEHELAEMKRDIDIMKLKYQFIDLVIKGEIEINGKSKQYITDRIRELLPAAADKCDLLLGMPIFSLTTEKKEELLNSMKKLSAEYKSLKEKSEYDIWLEEIDKI
jgi:DNA topoisomerase-2